MEAIKPTGKIIRGSGSFLSFLQELVRTDDFNSICLVTSRGMLERNHHLRSLSQKVSSESMIFVSPNPELSDLEEQIEKLRLTKFAHLIAVGGGSVLDSAKIFAFMYKQKEIASLKEALSGYNEGGPNEESNFSVCLVPTTSGTGAEVTPFATVWDSTTFKKFSLGGLCELVDAIILDPLLVTTVPRDASLYFGLDTISHCFESLWNKNKTKQSEETSLLALKLSVEALTEILEDLSNIKAREKMQYASFLAGKAIAQTKTALAHSMSYPLTLHYGVPHGLACSFTLTSIYSHLSSSSNELNYVLEREEIALAINFLQSQELEKKISLYLTLDQAQELTYEMFDPNRASNFITGPSLPIKKIIKSSFKSER